ncbi:MAG: hypothetical protein AAGN82_14250 [Myxococcota bacterium]
MAAMHGDADRTWLRLRVEIHASLLEEAVSELKRRLLGAWAARYAVGVGGLLFGLGLLEVYQPWRVFGLVGFYGLSLLPVLKRRRSLDTMLRAPRGDSEWRFGPQRVSVQTNADSEPFEIPKGSIRGLFETHGGLAFEHQSGWLFLPRVGFTEPERRSIRQWLRPSKDADAAKSTPIVGPKGRGDLWTAVAVVLAWGTLILVFGGIWFALAPKV